MAKNKTKFTFFSLIILSIFLIFYIAFQNRYVLDNPYFEGTVAPVISNIEFSKNYVGKIALKFDDKFYPYSKKIDNIQFAHLIFKLKNEKTFSYNNVFYEKKGIYPSKPVEKMYLTIQNGFENEVLDNIISLSLIIGPKIHYFTSDDIKKWEKKNETFCADKDCEYKTKVSSYSVPDNIKFDTQSKFFNYRGNFNFLTIAVLSLIYQWQLYILPYFLLFCALLIFIKNREIFEINLEKFTKNKHFYNILLILLLIFGSLIRINQLGYDPAWNDELYLLTIASNPNAPFSSVFIDAGNPPLFFFLSKIWLILGGFEITFARILPMIIGILSVYTVFACLNYTGHKKIALLGAFLTAINLVNISFSQEIRPYILMMCLAPLIMLYLFKMQENADKKNCTLYALFGACIANTHFYGVLLIVINYFYSAFQTFFVEKNTNSENMENSQNDKLKKFLKITLTNFIIALSFLPYFLYTMLANSFKEGFNNWLPQINFEICKELLRMYFINRYVFFTLFLIVLFIVFCIIAKKCEKNSIVYKISDKFMGEVDEKRKKFIFYIIYCALSIFALALLISLARPIIIKRYFVILIPYFSMLCAILATLPYKFKYKEFLSIFLIFIFTYAGGFYSYQQKKAINHISLIDYVVKDSEHLKDKYDIYAVVIDYPQYLKYFKKELENSEHIHFIIHKANNINISMAQSVSSVLKDGRPKVIYFNCFGLYVRDKKLYDSENVNVFRLRKDTSNFRIIYEE